MITSEMEKLKNTLMSEFQQLRAEIRQMTTNPQTPETFPPIPPLVRQTANEYDMEDEEEGEEETKYDMERTCKRTRMT